MKKNNYFYIVIFVCYVYGCKNDNSRIEQISEHSGLRLPNSFEVIQNTTEEVWPDYEINITLSFDSASFINIITQVDSLENVDSKWKKGKGIYKFEYENFSEPEYIIIDKANRTLRYNMVHL